MIRALRFFGFCLSFILIACTSLAAEEISSNTIIHHDIKVVLHPKEHTFVVEDTVTIPDRMLPQLRFFLHKGIDPSSPAKGVKIVKDPGFGKDLIFDSYEVELPQGVNTFLIKYNGSISHPIEQHGKEQARGISQTLGIISDEGVYLSGSSFWYPVFDDEMVTFKLHIELPPAWDAVSQGERTEHKKEKGLTLIEWDSPEPQEEIYIIAARFYEYTSEAGKLSAMVFLRTPDKGLAGKYLEATSRYISMYDKLIAPYPYKKFALVENFWETGFGMPSFTLLGPKVIRFPFIIDTSYPHEILHNWWGNSVFPDYQKGNWSEGLTAYLSDYLFREQKGEGAEYRQTTLQKYADYVTGGTDFPLTGFRSRHSSSSEAIGYGKSLMFFHMLRQELGDSTFLSGLRDFYRENRFKLASFDDIRKSFGRVTGKELKTEFDQWLTRPGAPELRVKDVKSVVSGDQYVLSAIIEQIQHGPIFHLRVPVAISIEGRERAYQTVVAMDKERVGIKLDLPSRPLRIDVDPEFDVFRRLDRDEVPPAISQVLGAKKMLVVLPSSAGKPLIEAYQSFAGSLINSGPDEVKTVFDKDLAALPSDRAVAIIGWENRFVDTIVSAVSPYGTTISRENIRIGKTEIPFKNHSLVLTMRNTGNKDMAIIFVASDMPDALSGLGRKLPHYHKYSYLVFEGAEPANIAKGRWPVPGSPMMLSIPGPDGLVSKVEMGKLEKRKPLIALESGFSAERMIETIRFLSSDELKGRASGTEGSESAAAYIARKFSEAGLKPAGDEAGSYFQTWEEPDNSNHEHKALMKNVIGVIPGKNPGWSAQSVIVGAHYDHLGVVKGEIYYGADDNASGIAVLIELAAKLGKNLDPDRNIIFVAFTGEETGKKGSKYYIDNQKRYPANQAMGMLNLDTVGRLGGKKLLVLGTGSAKEWTHIFRGAGHVAGVGVETVSEELDSSDQKGFQEAGVPAVQLFTGPHPDYHRPSDTIEKIDPEGLIKVASVTKEAIEYLASRQGPLTASISSEGRSEPVAKKERKVSLGIIPDFAFAGNGCRLSGVIQESPAEKAGLKEGDIIIRINSAEIYQLKDLSDILKSLAAGDIISIIFLREDREMRITVEVAKNR